MNGPAHQLRTARQHWGACLIFVAVLVVVFYRAIFLGEVLAPLDLLTKELPWQAVLPADGPVKNSAVADVLAVFYPWKHFVHDELQAGRFPLWCKSVGCGYPLAGAGTIKLFGLTTLCLWVASPPVASLVSFALQLFVALSGMYVLLGALRLRWGAAVFGALVYGLNSALIQYLEFEHMTGGLMMLPWMCWALGRGDWRGVALAGLFFGLAIIHGSVQSAAIVWLSAGGFMMAILWRTNRKRMLGGLAAMTGLGVLVGAIALVPNLELLALNARQRLDRLDWWELTWKRPVAVLPWLAAMINPDSIGNYQTFDLMRALGRMGTSATTPSMSDIRVYCGLGGLVVAVFGLRSSHPARRIGLWLVVVPLVVAVVTPLYVILYFRVLSAGACGIAILAAVGWERWLEGDRWWRQDCRRMGIGLVVAAGLALTIGAAVTTQRSALLSKVERAGAAGTSFYRSDKQWQSQKAAATVANFSWRGAAVARFAIVALLTAGLLFFGATKTTGAVLLVLFNTGDLVEFAQRTTPSAPAAFDYPPTPAVEFLRQQPGLFRVSSGWNADRQPPTARANLLLSARLDDPRVYESLVPANPLLARQDWDALGVRFFICPPDGDPAVADWVRVFAGEVDVYENPRAEPRVYFTDKLAHPPVAAARVEEYVSGRIRVVVESPQAGWLVVGERSYPGWQARVNGERAKIVVARELWQAVPVAAGSSLVELRYQPRSVWLGGLLSLVGVALVAISGWVCKQR